eukprot:4347905-Pyramimonas_sp.AAC.1
MWFALSSTRGILRHRARTDLTVREFWAVSHVMHRVDRFLPSVGENSIIVGRLCGRVDVSLMHSCGRLC